MPRQVVQVNVSIYVPVLPICRFTAIHYGYEVVAFGTKEGPDNHIDVFNQHFEYLIFSWIINSNTYLLNNNHCIF